MVTAAQDTYLALGKQIKSDFTGQGSFLYWALAIVFVGVIGYVEKLRPLSTGLMTLVLLSLFLSHKGFFQNLQAGFSAKPITPASSAPSSNGGGFSAAIQSSIPPSVLTPSTSGGNPAAELPGLPGVNSNTVFDIMQFFGGA